MKKDPKQIVTPFAFDVHKDLLGLPLATPRRRFAALLLDLIFASILSALSAWLLASAATVLFFWLAIRSKSTSIFKYIMRFSGAALFSIIVFATVFYFTKSEDTFSQEEAALQTVQASSDNSDIITANSENVDWSEFSKKAMSIDYTDAEKAEEGWERLEEQLEKNLKSPYQVNDLNNDELYSNIFSQNLRSFDAALQRRDTLTSDSLRKTIVPIIAAQEIGSRDKMISEYEENADKMEEQVEELQEIVDNPSMVRSIKAIATDFGMNFGWIGIYFILCLAFFKGRTLGKKMLHLQVVRLNNEPIGLWYSFERFGGYAAGFATGLLGFFQVYWDPNRQAIHDKIAATVVIDLRSKKKEKTESLRTKVFDDK